VGSKKSDSPKKTIAAAAKQPAALKIKGKAPPAKSNGASAAKAAARDEDDDEDDDDDEERSSSAPPPTGAKANGKTKEQLIKLGKSKGFLTYDDVHEALPGEETGPDQMDDVLSALDDEEIEVVDDASNIKIAPRGGVDDEGQAKPAA
jgi:RNA polymerase primary sigma factor